MKPIRLPYFIYRFTLEGLNLERFIAMASKENIPLLALRRVSARRMVCEAYQADMPQVEALVTQKGWKILDPQPLHLSAAMAFLRRRWGIPVGALLMVALTVTLYQFIWRVDIQGAGPYQGDMAVFLQQEGYGPGFPKARINADDLTQQLNHRYPQVAWLTAYVHDITLVISCTLGAPPPSFQTGSQGDIVASRDGLVQSVQVHAGTAVVQPGALVRKGQLLIRGSERGADETLHPVQARGIVQARCWTARSVKFSLQQADSNPTGRELAQQQLCTPWLCYPDTLAAPDYLAYDTQLTLTPLVGSYLPIWVKQVVYQEVALEYTLRDPQLVQAEAQAAVLRKLSDAMAGNEIVDKWVDYCMIEGGFLQATATAEWITDIGSAALP